MNRGNNDRSDHKSVDWDTQLVLNNGIKIDRASTIFKWLRNANVLPFPCEPKTKGPDERVSALRLYGDETGPSFLVATPRRIKKIWDIWNGNGIADATPKDFSISINLDPGFNGGQRIAFIDLDEPKILKAIMESEVLEDCPVVKSSKGGKIFVIIDEIDADKLPDDNIKWYTQESIKKNSPLIELYFKTRHGLIWGEHPDSTPTDPIYYQTIRNTFEHIPVLRWDVVLSEVLNIANDLGLQTREELTAHITECSYEIEGKQDFDDISLRDIYTPSGRTRKTRGGVLCVHPVHGSSTGINFHFNERENAWYCFRCSSGGGPLQLKAMLMGLVDCADVKSLTKEQYKKVFDELRADGIIQEQGHDGHTSPTKQTRVVLNNDESITPQDIVKAGNNALLRVHYLLTKKYHHGDDALILMGLRVGKRIGFNSLSKLLHLDVTGDAGTGKGDVADKILATFPDDSFVAVHTSSPTALFYDTLEWKENDVVRNGKPKSILYRISNPEKYAGKIILIAEARDASEHSALKAFAEGDQYKTYEHKATVNGQTLTMKVHGPRSVWTTSARGMDDEQVLRRFIHTAVEEETKNNKLAKAYFMMGNDVDRKSIANDPFTHLIKDALTILFADRDGVVFYEPDDETRELMLYLAVFFAESGFSTTSIAQFNALCECAAFEKRFARGNDPGVCTVMVEDVLESWWLLNKFDDLTKSKLTQKELKILRAIKEYNESHLNEELSATQIDVKEKADVGQSIISSALSTRSNAEGKLGKLIELNYVGYDYRHNPETDRNVACYYLTPNGKRVISESVESIKIDKKGYEKICPTIIGNEYEAADPTKGQKEPENVISVISEGGGYWEKDGEVVISKNGSQYDKIISNILISIKKRESGVQEEEKGVYTSPDVDIGILGEESTKSEKEDQIGEDFTETGGILPVGQNDDDLGVFDKVVIAIKEELEQLLEKSTLKPDYMSVGEYLVDVVHDRTNAPREFIDNAIRPLRYDVDFSNKFDRAVAGSIGGGA